MPKKLLCMLVMAGMVPLARSGPFDDAAAELRAGRGSAAYGRFVAAANAGDPDAARFALLMVRYGPLVWGAHWAASPDEYEFWQQLADGADGRNLPAFKPSFAPPRGIQCSARPAVSWAMDC